jgi:hypothetical protein
MRPIVATKAVVVVSLGFIVVACGSPRSPQTTAKAQAAGTDATKSAAPDPKPAAPVQSTKPEEYHDVDPVRAGFTFALQLKSLSTDAYGEVRDGIISSAKISDDAFGNGHLYPLELASRKITRGKIHTTTFGDIPVRSDSNSMTFKMTDSQVREVQNFLMARKSDAKH